MSGERADGAAASGAQREREWSASMAHPARVYDYWLGTPVTLRTFGQVARFLDGLELVEPGIVQCHRWRPRPGDAVDDYEVAGWAAVGRKP